MLANTVRTRGASFGCIFGPPRFVTREEAMQVHNAVCVALSHDDLSFRYEPHPVTRKGPQGFKIEIGGTDGSGCFTILNDFRPQQQPGLRLLVQYDWPQSYPHVQETADKTAEAILRALPGNWQRILAEVRLRAMCEAEGNDALTFLRSHLCNFDESGLTDLGDPLQFCSVRLEIAEKPHGDDSLANPKREITIEVLRDNTKMVYIELMSQWNQIVPRPTMDISDLQPDRLRSFDFLPSEYIEDAQTYLNSKVLNLRARSGT